MTYCYNLICPSCIKGEFLGGCVKLKQLLVAPLAEILNHMSLTSGPFVCTYSKGG